MKTIIITSIILTTCIALYAAIWPQSAEDKNVPVKEKLLIYI